MKVTLRLDDAEIREKIKDWNAEDIITVWSEAVLRLAKANASRVIGTGSFGRSIEQNVELENHGLTAEIKMAAAQAYVGAHVHYGGPVKSRSGKTLAIPLPTSSTAKYNPQRLFASDVKEKLFLLTSRRGNKLLFRATRKGEALELPLFVLKDQTRPQKPRPWWPSEAECNAAFDEFVRENF